MRYSYRKWFMILFVALATCLGMVWAADAAYAADNQLTEEELSSGWQLLFNGHDATGWKNNNGKPLQACVEEGSLNAHKSGGNILIYDKPFGDFVLKCDVKMGDAGCNSGIFFRIGNLMDPVQSGFEMQVYDSAGHGRNDFGSLYDLVAPSENASHGFGKWDAVEIRCQGPLISVKVNGKDVTTMNCDDFDQPGRRPDGSKHKYRKAIKDFPRSGYLGFQNHGDDAWYRNVKLLEL